MVKRAGLLKKGKLLGHAPGHICSLRSFRTLGNLEFNRVPLVQGFVSLADDCRIVDKYIWTVIAPDKPVPSGVVEPFDYALHLASSLDRPGMNSATRDNHSLVGTSCAGRTVTTSNEEPTRNSDRCAKAATSTRSSSK